jgi:hypothetical protein
MRKRKEVVRRAKNLERRNAAWWARTIKREKNRRPDPVAQNLEAARRAHEAGNPFGLIDAVIYCNELAGRVQLPRWALGALAKEYVAQLRGEELHKRMGRHASILEEHKRRHIDYARFEAVEGAREHRYSRSDAFEKAVQLCDGTPAKADTAAMRLSYFKVKRMMRQTPGNLYLSMYSRYFVPCFGKKLTPEK